MLLIVIYFRWITLLMLHSSFYSALEFLRLCFSASSFLSMNVMFLTFALSLFMELLCNFCQVAALPLFMHGSNWSMLKEGHRGSKFMYWCSSKWYNELFSHFLLYVKLVLCRGSCPCIQDSSIWILLVSPLFNSDLPLWVLIISSSNFLYELRSQIWNLFHSGCMWEHLPFIFFYFSTQDWLDFISWCLWILHVEFSRYLGWFESKTGTSLMFLCIKTWLLH